MTNLQDEVLGEYLSECQEMIERLSLLLRSLEKDGGQPEAIRSFARDIHTIKGSSQLFGFKTIGHISHAVEECLSRLRHVSPMAMSELTDDLYLALDAIVKQLASIRQTRSESLTGDDYRRLIERLHAFQPENLHHRPVIPFPGEDGESPHAKVGAGKPEPLASNQTELQLIGRSQDVRQLHDREGSRSLGGEVESVILPSTSLPGGKSPAYHEESYTDTIRVHVDHLDNLMNLVSELVLIRNQVHEIARLEERDDLSKLHQRLNFVSSELQTNVMKTRMQPVSHVLGKFHRLVRESARDLGKHIELVLHGTETELDKALLEAVRDPLTHIVRNAIDHGIEAAAERKRLGKSETGTIRIASYHESGHVIIEVSDDGRGLNRDRIAAKALEKGLVSPEAFVRLSDRDILQFIFLPGFSTAETVSDLSGRGVGMDVVKNNIESIGGTVDFSSIPNQGTSFRLKIPLTLAIMSALIVRCAEHIFAIPQVKLVELLRISRDEMSRYFEILHDRPVMRRRGQILTVIDFAATLDPRKKPFDRWDRSETINVVVLSGEHDLFGLVVERIEDSIDIVVKPLPSFLRDLKIYSGATILGDGSIALTLDVGGLASCDHPDEAGILDSHDAAKAQTAADLETSDPNVDYLLVEDFDSAFCAIPVCVLHRLEEVPLSSVQACGDQRVIKYGDALLPIFRIADVLDWRAVGETKLDKISLVVVRKMNRMFGLEFKSILDIFQASSIFDTASVQGKGIIGSVIRADRVVTVLDTLSLVDLYTSRYPGLAAVSGNSSPASRRTWRPERARYHVLLVEDSSFFRNHVRGILLQAGYQVTTAMDGQKAIQFLEKSHERRVDAIISDIEMPGMDGLDLARELRSRSNWGRIPLLALSSRYSQDDIKRGEESGFNRYIEKLNPDQLICEVDGLLGLSEGA